MYTGALPSPIGLTLLSQNADALARPATVQLAPWKAEVNDQPIRAWRELATDWRVWLSLALSLLIATVAWLLGYD